MSELLHVLIVEDSEDDARLVLRELRRSGYEPVFERVDTEAAMRKALRDKPWELILSDYMIPGFGGLEALRIAEASDLDVPFVLVSNKVSEETLVEAMRAGAMDFVMKDRLSRLGPVVKRELADAAVRRAAITDRRRAEDALLKSERDLKEAQRLARIGSWDWDAQSDTITWSDEYYRIYGFDPTRRPPGYEDHLKAYTRESAARLDAAVKRNMQTGESYELELELAGTEGSPRWVTARSETKRDEHGRIVGLRGTAQDITERRRAEQALRESEETLRMVAASAQDAILMLDNDGKIALWNSAAQKMFGYSSVEVTGKELHSLLAPVRFHDPFRHGFSQFKATGEGPVIGRTLEMAALRKGGTEFPVELSLSAVKLKDKWQAIGIVRDITTRKQSELALDRTSRALRTLSACNEALVRAGDESGLLVSICRLIVETGGYRMAWVGYSAQDAEKTVCVAAKFGDDEDYLGAARIRWADCERGRGPTGTAIRTGAVQANRSFLTNPAVALWREAALKRGYQSSIALPLKGSAGTFGALTLYAGDLDAFNEDEIRLLQELAADLAFGIETLRTRADRDRVVSEHLHAAETLRRSLEDSIKAIADTVEMRDPYTAGHQRRVGNLAVAIATELGLTEESIHGIKLAASIHDLGKISVPAEILAKPARLTDIEMMLVKNHAQAGYDILKDIKFPWPIATVVWQHHERVDGSGYPLGLKGEQILLESRIMAVADVVEAISSHRPYRPALGMDRALAEIERGRGSWYDANAVDACLRVFREQRYQLPA